MNPPPPGPTLFPYTTLFRSASEQHLSYTRMRRNTRRLSGVAIESITVKLLALIPENIGAVDWLVIGEPTFTSVTPRELPTYARFPSDINRKISGTPVPVLTLPAIEAPRIT